MLLDKQLGYYIVLYHTLKIKINTLFFTSN